MPKRTPLNPTMQDIGEKLGVSKATVSLALRNHPRISPEMRQRVQQAASELGYRMNPLVAAHMTQLRMGRPASYHATIAVVQWGGEHSLRDLSWRVRYRRGIEARCEQLGYRVFFVDMETQRYSPERLHGVLNSRGIQGVILLEPAQPGPAPALPWARYAPVAVGYTITAPEMHRACTDPYWIAESLLGELEARGYTRPGLALRSENDQRVSQRVQARFLAWQRAGSRRGSVPPLVCEHLDAKDLCGWLEKYEPDVIVSPDPWLPKHLQTLGYSVPRDVGFATTCCLPPYPDSSGFDQNFELVGSAAVDLVIGQLNRNERGIPDHPKLMLMRGVWHEGSTLRPQAAVARR